MCLKITVTSVLPQTQLGFKYNFDCPSLCFNILLIVYHLQFSPIKLAVERPWLHHYNQDSLLIPMYLTNQVESWLNLMKIINFLLQHAGIHVWKEKITVMLGMGLCRCSLVAFSPVHLSKSVMIRRLQTEVNTYVFLYNSKSREPRRTEWWSGFIMKPET